jgi:ATP-dependent DNA helicase DinG
MGYFSKDGPIAKRLGTAYRERPEQTRLVDAIVNLQPGDKLFGHGPVATGKNAALGVAALMSGHRTVLSTYTRTLLDSLAEEAEQWREDFPDKLIIVMRGRANYICLAKLAQMKDTIDHQPPAQRKRHLAVIKFAESNKLVAAPGAPDDTQKLAQRSCPGQKKCDYGQQCHYYQERELCASADLTITTHAMVRANCEYPSVDHRSGELWYWFPRDLWIADEGDRLLDACSDDSEISGHAIAAIMQDPLISAQVRLQLDKLLTFAHEKCVGQYRSANIDPRPWREYCEKTIPLLESCIAEYPPPDGDADEPLAVLGMRRLSVFLNSMLGEVKRGYAMAIKPPTRNLDPELRRYLSCSFRSRPISVGNAIANQVQVFRRFAAVSGSLALPTPAGPSFAFHESLMRVHHNRELVLKSPIDYDRNLRVVYEQPPKHLDSNARQQCFAELALRLHREAGNTVILCTSYASIARVVQEFENHGLQHELLQQSTDSVETVNALAQQLKQGKRASIVATTSGWVGLDLDARFKACVLVERVPVPSVSQDLCLHGRIMRDGENAAYDQYGTPTALKLGLQGCGRTLRRETDRCLLVVCDRRYIYQDYSAAIPGGKPVTLSEGIEWIRRELGAPAQAPESSAPEACAEDNMLDMLVTM